MRQLLITAPLILLVAACGGSDTGTSTALFAINAGAVNRAYADGATLKTQSGTIVAQRFSYRDDTAELMPEPAMVSLSQSADGTFNLVYGDRTFELGTDARSLEDDGVTSYGFEKEFDAKDGSGEVEYIGLWSQEGKLEEVLAVDREDYAQVWMIWMGTQGAPTEQLHFVVGTETKPEALGEFTTEDYDGFAYAEVRDTAGDPNDRKNIRFEDTTLTANFTENTLSASFSGTQVRGRTYDADADRWLNGEYSDVDGGLTLTGGAISGNSFSGSLAANDALTQSLGIEAVTGDLNGKFYGPSAEQAAGTFSGTVRNSAESTSVVTGWFDAFRPTE